MLLTICKAHFSIVALSHSRAPGTTLHRASRQENAMFIEFAILKGLLSEQRMSQAPLSLNFLYQPC
jgi:hypothetical protein